MNLWSYWHNFAQHKANIFYLIFSASEPLHYNFRYSLHFQLQIHRFYLKIKLLCGSNKMYLYITTDNSKLLEGNIWNILSYLQMCHFLNFIRTLSNITMYPERPKFYWTDIKQPCDLLACNKHGVQELVTAQIIP